MAPPAGSGHQDEHQARGPGHDHRGTFGRPEPGGTLVHRIVDPCLIDQIAVLGSSIEQSGLPSRQRKGANCLRDRTLARDPGFGERPSEPLHLVVFPRGSLPCAGPEIVCDRRQKGPDPAAVEAALIRHRDRQRNERPVGHTTAIVLVLHAQHGDDPTSQPAPRVSQSCGRHPGAGGFEGSQSLIVAVIRQRSREAESTGFGTGFGRQVDGDAFGVDHISELIPGAIDRFIDVPVDHGRRDCPLIVLNRVGRADVVARERDARLEPLQHSRFTRIARDEVKRMDRPALADTVDSSDSLFEAHRVPRELEVDHDPAPMVQVQAFASRVGGKKEPAAAADELIEGGDPLLARQAAVQDRGRPLQHGVEVKQRVAVFRESGYLLDSGSPNI
jgi:hypothetical protein